ncbi:hypothetical protein V6N13_003370 [Hibiscus sabdariffa]
MAETCLAGGRNDDGARAQHGRQYTKPTKRRDHGQNQLPTITIGDEAMAAQGYSKRTSKAICRFQTISR